MDYFYNNSSREDSGDKIKKRRVISEIYEWVDAVVIAIIAIILLFTFAFRVVGIKGESMQNTLLNNDRVIISNLFYTPKCGDIVVISRNYTNTAGDTNPDDSPIIKRVIATEGQEITIDPENDTVTVDGTVLDETYVKPGQVTTWTDGTSGKKTITIEKGHVFVMGDNRGNSLDSRSSEIGQVDTRYILGRAFLRIYPKLGGL